MTQPQAPTPASAFNLEALDLQRLNEESRKLLSTFMNQNEGGLESTSHITKAFLSMAEQWAKNPEKLVQRQMELYQSYLQLWANMAERMMGQTPTPLMMPEKGDRRFSHQGWESNLVFDYIKQSYLLASQWLQDNVRETDGIDEKTRAKVDFYTRQFIDAMSPSNFPMTNPEVLEKTIETKGENLIKGLQHLLEDMQRGGGKLKISMTDYKAFEVGKNLGTTEGAVVYQNRMFQLIQYKPKGAKTQARPLLITPPWINKFYILDLQAENSFVRYAVEECGLQVFLISWKNPDETYRDVGFEDYVKEGLLEAITQTLAITNQKDLNVIGYCIGGTMLTTALAYMQAKKDKRVNSATFFTTLMDFSEAGELGVFLDEEQVAQLEKKMEKTGYLNGAEMAQTFSMLRANDLIWNFVVNNYLLGQDPFPFDLLYWNDDPTRMPAKMHSYYLRNMYLENNLVKPNKMEILGEKIDIRTIETPMYMVSAVNDHITPWKSCFAPLHTLKSKIRFVLGKAGHVAGVVTPPGNPKRAYWTGEVNGQKDADAWLKTAQQGQDSWWPDWKAWIQERSGEQVAAPKTLGDTTHPVLEAAPGSYVKEKA